MSQYLVQEVYDRPSVSDHSRWWQTETQIQTSSNIIVDTSIASVPVTASGPTPMLECSGN